MNTPTPNNHHYAQAQSYAQDIAEIFYTVRQEQKALDRVLKNYFKEMPECGAQDRRFIRDGVSSLWRWYGWLKHSIPQEAPINPITSTSFCQALGAALWLAHKPLNPVIEIILQAAEINSSWWVDAPKTLDGKKKGLRHLFKFNKCATKDLVPAWISQELPKSYDLTAFIETLQIRSPIWLRTQRQGKKNVLQELDVQRIKYQQHPRLSKAISLETPSFHIQNYSSYRHGFMEVQDLASQCIGQACGATPGQQWWDVCTGAGGKTLLLADHMNNQGLVVATDKREWILEECVKRQQRAQFTNIQCQPLWEVFGEQTNFDGVLIDAPCSATGTWRRNPESRWITKPQACAQFAKMQYDILTQAATKVRANGLLIYATCSVSIHENEGVVQEFLQHNPHFMLENFPHPLTEEPTNGLMRINFMPDNCDAMFAARLRKKW